MAAELQLLAFTKPHGLEGPTDIRIIRDLSGAEVVSYRSAAREFFEYVHWHTLIAVVQENHREFGDSVQSLSTLRPKFDPKVEILTAVQLNVNRRLANFLSSARLFLDHTELRLKRRYGKRSPEVEAFKSATSNAYDGVFAYRFFYRLRNYAQHCGMPVGGIVAESSVDESSRVERHTISYWFDVEQLLRVGDDVWGNLRPELEAGPDRLSVDEMAVQVMDELRGLSDRVVQIEYPRLQAAANVILAIVKDASGPNTMAQVGTISRDKDALGFVLEDVPLTIMASLGFVKLSTPSQL